MGYKFISKNTLGFLSLHDCIIENVYMTNQKLILVFKSINVLVEHPLNNYKIAMCSDKAALIFENYSVVNCVLYDTASVKKKHIEVPLDAKIVSLNILDLAKGFEVLEAREIEKRDSFFVYQFFGQAPSRYNSDFALFEIWFKAVKVCWNKLVDKAWFVELNC